MQSARMDNEEGRHVRRHGGEEAPEFSLHTSFAKRAQKSSFSYLSRDNNGKMIIFNEYRMIFPIFTRNCCFGASNTMNSFIHYICDYFRDSMEK